MLDENLLITLVQSNAHLYDKCHVDYKDVFKKENTWEFIAQAMKINKDQCKARWTTMRQQFSKEKKEEDSSKSGDGGVIKKSRYLQSLSFLRPHVQGRKLKTNMCVPSSCVQQQEERAELEVDVEEFSIPDFADILSPTISEKTSSIPEAMQGPSTSSWRRSELCSPSPPPAKKIPEAMQGPSTSSWRRSELCSPSPPPAKKAKKVANSVDDAIVNVGNTLQRMVERRANPPPNQAGVDELFASYIGAELQTFKNKKNLNLAKKLIIKMIFDLKDEEEDKVVGEPLFFV